MATKPKLIRANLPGFVAEGHLYRLADQHFVVFTETAVAEDRQPLACEDDVRPDRSQAIQPDRIVNAEAEPGSVQPAA